MKKIILFTIHFSLLTLLVSCEKVSPIGVLVSNTAVEDRVKMSYMYYKDHKLDVKWHSATDKEEYTFLVGADSHLTTDGGRMREMLQNALDHDDLMITHLGDIADTKPEYYILLDDIIDEYRWKYAKKYYEEIYIGYTDDPSEKADPESYLYVDSLYGAAYTVDKVPYPFYPVVGNHDITHNGWALWSNIFHSSFYDVYVVVSNDEPITLDHFIFLDSASGTLGRKQVELIEEGVLDGNDYEKNGYLVRHTFVFGHTNIFRPSSLEFASTFPREESFFLLNQFKKWDACIVFFGHVHKWDYQRDGVTEYITLDSMCEANNPKPGDYLLRVHVKKDGTVTWEKVRMNYVKE